jgi:hypothetical protein
MCNAVILFKFASLIQHDGTTERKNFSLEAKLHRMLTKTGIVLNYLVKQPALSISTLQTITKTHHITWFFIHHESMLCSLSY